MSTMCSLAVAFVTGLAPGVVGAGAGAIHYAERLLFGHRNELRFTDRHGNRGGCRCGWWGSC